MHKDLLQALEWRYATKKFNTDKLVSKEILDKIVEAFNLTATSYGLQPVKLFVIGDKILKEKLTLASWGQNQVKTSSHILVFCIREEITPDYIHAYFDREIKVRQTNPDILLPYRERIIKMFNNFNEEEVRIWATNQAYLTLGNILTYCAYEGIDTCPMEGFDSSQVDKVLNLEALGLKSVLLLPIGYRSSDDFFLSLEKVRKSIEESVVFYE